ncbi:MAG: glycosyltransferase [Rikenellaceae bacterium]
MQYFQILMDSYGWQGLALMGTIILLIFIQIYYYSFRFGPIGRYLNKHRAQRLSASPPISVVVPMFSEDYDYLDETLPLLLSQDEVEFEVVIVYVGCDGDFYDDLLRLKESFPNISATKIERNDRFPISIKTALNVGIKAARHEHMIFTTADARPSSQRWLELMARGFQRGDVVIGYCAVDTVDDKFDSYFIRATRFESSMMWLSRAIGKRPYRAIRSNMGFTQSLYFGSKGFNRLNMNIGEDDLFMQKIMQNNNTSVILSPRATMLQHNWGRMDGLVDTSRYFGSAERFYPSGARNYVAWELTARLLLFALSVVGLIFLPLELKGVIIILLLLRIALMLAAVKSVSARVGERKMVGRYLLYDLLNPLFKLYMRLVMIRKDSRVWR